MNWKKYQGKDFFLGAMVGSTLGALTTIVFATKKGHRVQQEIANRYEEFQNAFRKLSHRPKSEKGASSWTSSRNRAHKSYSRKKRAR